MHVYRVLYPPHGNDYPVPPSPFPPAPNEECVSLEAPVNGTILINGINGTQIGDMVSYECDTGFTLVGVENRTCNMVGLWTGSDPVCQSELGCECVCGVLVLSGCIE